MKYGKITYWSEIGLRVSRSAPHTPTQVFGEYPMVQKSCPRLPVVKGIYLYIFPCLNISHMTSNDLPLYLLLQTNAVKQRTNRTCLFYISEGWDRTSASGSRYQSISDLIHPPYPWDMRYKNNVNRPDHNTGHYVPYSFRTLLYSCFQAASHMAYAISSIALWRKACSTVWIEYVLERDLENIFSSSYPCHFKWVSSLQSKSIFISINGSSDLMSFHISLRTSTVLISILRSFSSTAFLLLLGTPEERTVYEISLPGSLLTFER